MANAQQQPEYLVDGQALFIGGQDASKLPDRIGPNAYASGINVTAAKGGLSPRWGFSKVELDFSSTGEYTFPTGLTKAYKTIFEGGKFQFAIPYPFGPDYYNVIVISGIIFFHNISTNAVTVVPISDGSLIDGSQDRIYGTLANPYLVIHDFPNYPVIINGPSARRANPALYEVPISILSTYNQNRLFIGNAGNNFTAGDPAGNLATPEAPITFTEIEAPQAPYLGQIFALPTSANSTPITAMTFLTLDDTSTGIGPLIVATRERVYTFQSQLDRADWQNGQFGSAYVHDSGIVGQRAYVNLGNDIFFVSQEGYIRSANMSRVEQYKWSRAPLSFEIQNWLKFDDPSLMQFTPLAYFNNKIFVGVNPFRTWATNIDNTLATDTAFLGMAVMELDTFSNLSYQNSPIWAGLWTGVRPMEFVTNNQRFFVVVKEPEYANAIYEVTPNLTIDQADGNYRYIRSRVYMKEHTFQDAFQNKDLHSMDLSLYNTQGDLKVTADYRPSHVTNFLPWRTFKSDTPWRTGCVPPASVINGFEGHQFRELVFGQPPNYQQCNPYSGELYGTFRKLQTRFTIEGRYWELHEYKLKAKYKAQPERETLCELLPIISTPEPCNDDWKTEDFTSCLQTKT